MRITFAGSVTLSVGVSATESAPGNGRPSMTSALNGESGDESLSATTQSLPSARSGATSPSGRALSGTLPSGKLPPAGAHEPYRQGRPGAGLSGERGEKRNQHLVGGQRAVAAHQLERTAVGGVLEAHRRVGHERHVAHPPACLR